MTWPIPGEESDRGEGPYRSVQDLDKVDQQILSDLAVDARNTSGPEIADKVDVSPGTIRNRIENLVSSGVIEAHRSEINYGELGLLKILFICTVKATRLDETSDQLATVPEVIETRELLSGSHNLHVSTVAETQRQTAAIERRLTAMDIEIEEICLVGDEQRTPYGLGSDSAQSGVNDE